MIKKHILMVKKMRRLIIKALFTSVVAFISLSHNSQAGYDVKQVSNHKYICTTNGGYSYHPNASGDARWTYGDVKTVTNDAGGGQYVHLTKCNDPGKKACHAGKVATNLYNDLGILVYTADYENEFIDFAESFAGDRIAEGENSGKESFNEIKGKFKIYRSVSWNMDENNKAIKIEISIVTTETVED